MKTNKKPMPGIPQVAATEESARAYLEATLWPNGAVCPNCKGQNVYKMTPKATSTKPGRPGLYRCRPCKKQFTVTVGTIFEGSHIPLNKWLMAVHIMTASKKGISAHQLHRMLGITYKAAWFMCHRVRYAMTQEPVKGKLTGTVEVDETYVGGKHINRPLSIRSRETAPKKIPVVALVSRSGKMRSFPIKNAGLAQLKSAINENVDKKARLMTDDWKTYGPVGKEYASHDVVKHSLYQYVKPGNIHTNTVEGFFSLLKRGIMGTFHNISREHLAQYCGEFSFRWNYKDVTDTERAIAALVATSGKRLVYSNLQAQGAI